MVKSALARAGVSLGNEPESGRTVKEVPAFKPLAFQTALPPPPVPAFEEPAIEVFPRVGSDPY